MKSLNGVIITFLFLSVGCVENPHVRPTDASLPPGLETYFKGYCHAADNLGIGAVQSDTYDYRFRQRLSMADDAELKRLYVINNLSRDLEWELRDFEQGVVRTGKGSSNAMTLSQWTKARSEIEKRINDLKTYVAFTNFATFTGGLDYYEPDQEALWIKDLQNQLTNVRPPTDTK